MEKELKSSTRQKLYSLFTILIMFISIPYIQADCTNEEISKLKEEADKITATYEHLGAYETDYAIVYDQFKVEINDVPNEIEVNVFGYDNLSPDNNGTVEVQLSSGQWHINFIAKECNELIDTLVIKIPRFNTYSLDPLCEGIDGDDFALCGKYYEQEVSYASFKQRVEHYRTTYKIDEKNNKVDEDNNKGFNFNKILEYLDTYKLYILSTLGIIILLIVIIIIIKKRRNRGVLE